MNQLELPGQVSLTDEYVVSRQPSLTRAIVVCADMAGFEDELDALDEAIKFLGGYKKVAVRLRPEWEDRPEAAAQWLRDCLNRAKPEKLDLRQVMTILRWCKDAGYHEPKHWFDAELGYQPTPAITADAQRSQLAKDLRAGLELVERLGAQLARLEAQEAKR